MDIHDYGGIEFPHDEYDDPKDSFRIEDDQQAAWAMRKLLAARIRRDSNMQVADAERQRIEQWLEYVNAKHDRDIAYFEGILVEYASRMRVSDDRKSIDTPYGVVKSRQGQPRINVLDADEFINWARQGHEDLLTVKVSPSLAAIKALAEIEVTETLGPVAITPDGEVIPGLDIQPATVNYTVEVSK